MVRQQTELLIGASEYSRLPGWLLSRTVSFIQTLPRMQRKKWRFSQVNSSPNSPKMLLWEGEGASFSWVNPSVRLWLRGLRQAFA